MPQTFYEVVWIFIIYAFIGWCTEVSYAALERGIFVNRGFLNGPYCPIYGCGVVIVVAILTPLKNNLFILFLGSFLLTSALELVTGYVLETVFHNKWWDYSNKPFNIKGYVCLKFSIFWGLACSFIMLIIHPIIYKFITIIPHIFGVVLLCIIMTLFAVDCVVTVTTIMKFNRRLKVMDELAAKMKVLSNEIGENIFENVTEAVEKKEEFAENHEKLITNYAQSKEKIAENVENKYEKLNSGVQTIKSGLTSGKNTVMGNLEEARAEYEETYKKYRELAEKKIFGHNRLMKAFPDMKSKYNNESLNKLKSQVLKVIKKEK